MQIYQIFFQEVYKRNKSLESSILNVHLGFWKKIKNLKKLNLALNYYLRDNNMTVYL